MHAHPNHETDKNATAKRQTVSRQAAGNTHGIQLSCSTTNTEDQPQKLHFRPTLVPRKSHAPVLLTKNTTLKTILVGPVRLHRWYSNPYQTYTCGLTGTPLACLDPLTKTPSFRGGTKQGQPNPCEAKWCLLLLGLPYPHIPHQTRKQTTKSRPTRRPERPSVNPLPSTFNNKRVQCGGER